MGKKKKPASARHAPEPGPAASGAVLPLGAAVETSGVQPAADETHPALRHLGTIGAVLAAGIVLTYLAPPLFRFRPWLPGEAIPVLRFFVPEADPESGSDEIPAAEVETLDRLADEAPVPVPPPEHTLTVAPEEYAELTTRIADEAGAMRPFYTALARTARDRAGMTGGTRLTRVAHFGDSTIALDGITMTVRERLQVRFGDGGHGFVLAARGPLPYRHHMVRHESEGNWRVQDLTHLALADGHYGLGGVQSRAITGAEAWFATDDDEDAVVGTTVSRFDVLYQRHDRGGRFRYRVDDGEWTEVDSRADALADASVRVELPDGPHRLELRAAGHGETRLYGVVLERSGPGVVYDSLGIVGARAARMTGFDPEHLRDQLAARQTDLVVVAFGGNDADDERSEADFLATFREVAALVRRARPEAACLFVAPLDQAERDERGRVRTLGPLTRIVAAMETAASEAGCAYWNTFEAMGGAGTMGRWSRRGLASSDYRHATPAGYRVIGNLFYQALLAGFAEWLAAGEPEPGDGSAPGPAAPPPEAPAETDALPRGSE